jgi:2-oxo-4-hydroxy-4-carboxy-5-ureidoimidazoline decarboxylase
MKADMQATHLTLADITAMSQDEFVAALGDLFEHSPWVAQAAWAKHPFASEAALHEAMMDAVRSAPVARQIAFLRMHPELAGKEAQAGTMTGHSTFEQQGAGLNALTRDELLELQRLNAVYALRHGFPFIIKVLGHTKQQIFDALRDRAAHDTAHEIGEALAQISNITRRRLTALLSDPSSSSLPSSTSAKAPS